MTVEKAGKEAGPLVPQKHGGAIFQGTPANIVPGPGRPPSEIRKRLRGSFDERVKILEEIADNPELAPADRTKAIDMMGKYGLGQMREVSAESVKERLRLTIESIQQVLPPEQADAVLAAIEPHWL